jgi:H+-translocating NAD(P) transhydrogenase subunit alpha
MRVVILKERVAEEHRVAATPDTVSKILKLGAEVAIETGAGLAAGYEDSAYVTAGATVGDDATKLLSSSDIFLTVQSLYSPEISGNLPKDSTVIGMLSPYEKGTQLKAIAENMVTAFAIEFLPRITRAQSMDVLSSQSNLAGYRAVIEGFYHLQKVAPMMMTAAGTVKPAKVLVLGAGVAGLQAIATAKRMGAVVSAFDVRTAAKEQVESLGATFVEVPSDEAGDAAGGYAKEMSDDYKRKQRELLAKTLTEQDLVITTALIPGKPAPVLITEAMVKDMKQGSVILDLAAITGGNCEITVAGEISIQYGVTIVGIKNIPSLVAKDSSQLYATNLLKFLEQIISKETKQLSINMDDEIIKSTMVTYQGKIVHAAVADAPVTSAPRKAPAAASIPRKVRQKEGARNNLVIQTYIDKKPNAVLSSSDFFQKKKV